MKKISFTLFSLSLLSASCSSDDTPAIVNEDEVITTVVATFTPPGSTTPITLTSRDLDGDGPNAPVVTVSGNFQAGVTYFGEVTYTNELTTPPTDITEEIYAEGEEHQVFFQHTNLGQFVYNDEDNGGHPIGLDFSFTSSNTPATGNLTITLRHEPNKSAAGVAEGQIANAGGSTDAEVTFPIVVE